MGAHWDLFGFNHLPCQLNDDLCNNRDVHLGPVVIQGLIMLLVGTEEEKGTNYACWN